jgi:hypothetical protein
MAKISTLDFYAILGVHPNAEDIVIRAAFKALAQRYHPDRFNGSKDEAHRRMANLTNAYETLADPARRRKYDRRRGLSARQARFYFKNPARERQPPFTAFALRAAARKAQYYRNAVLVLMVIVVILSAFNVHQHAAQIRELFAWDRPASGTTGVAIPGSVAGTPAAPPATADPASATTTANVRILPIGPGTTRPIVPGGAEAQTPTPPAPDAEAAERPATPLPDAARTPAQSAIVEPQKAPVAATASRTPSVEPHKAPIAATSAASVANTAPKDAKRPAPPKPVAAKAAEPELPAAPPSAAEVDRCGPELVALGLCNRSSTAKGQ